MRLLPRGVLVAGEWEASPRSAGLTVGVCMDRPPRAGAFTLMIEE